MSPAKRFHEQQQSSTELFSKYIATTLDALPPRLAIQAQKDLHDVLVKYKMMEFDQEEEGSISTGPYTSSPEAHAVIKFDTHPPPEPLH